jgi:hypothetical protein
MASGELQQPDEAAQQVLAAFAETVGAIAVVAPLSAGRNSRCWRVRLSDGTTAVAKQYFSHPQDPRDRCGTEVAALRYLQRHGIAAVPRVIAADLAARVALISDAGEVAVTRPTGEDVAAVVALLRELHGLAAADAGAAAMPEASEASFSLGALADTLNTRFDRLTAAGDATNCAVTDAMMSFLECRLRPASVTALAEARACGALGVAAPLPRRLQTLSPSDMGFHNAVRGADGRLVFIDFEYFGWDDPAKTIADFLLHPAMDLSERCQREFVCGATMVYGADSDLAARIAATFPLYGCKWCCILLNEFCREDWARRAFAGGTNDRQAQLKRQLAKAEAMLDAVRWLQDAIPDWLAGAAGLSAGEHTIEMSD